MKEIAPRSREAELLDQTNHSTLLSREASVLAGGFADGLSKAGSTTASDISEAAQKFKEAPLKTTGEYLKNHWQDAAVGAAITFLNPKKWANAALLAYSMRGVGYATYEGAVAAADPKANLTEAREKFSNAISHEGTAFVSTLPMALAGGMVGRGAANSVFGKDLGALDLATGKVSVGQVKDNLLSIKDTISPPPVKLLITDMDNTLAPFSNYFAQGVKKGMAELSQKTNIPEAELYPAVGKVMDLNRAHDYPWSLEVVLGERLNVGKPGGMTAAEFRKDIAEPFWNTIDKSLVENHKAFPGVLETLQELKARNIPVAVLSDAPAFIGLRRLTNLGLDRNGLVERMYALDNWKQPAGMSSEMLAAGNERVNSMLNIANGLKEVRVIPQAWEKPHTDGYQALMKEYKVRPAETLMIGDSRVKDVGVAHNAGSRGIWAEYGNPNAVDEAILLRLRPLPENRPAPGTAPGSKKNYAPYLEAATSFKAVLNHLEPKPSFSNMASKTFEAMKVRPELGNAAITYGLTK